MPIQLILLCCWLGFASAAAPDPAMQKLFKQYEAYMVDGQGKAEDIFTARLLKLTPITKGALKGHAKKPMELKVRPYLESKERANVKIYPSSHSSFIVVKQGDKWLIDGQSGDDEE